ncbi:MAG: Xaa-Pro peptidase family protein [Acidobacteria bacterium]|nr:Xaa-Pro peptidase family protein [Acidobacteriota bacterium]MDA1233963.1 Xaa-Pro peptidase family protein [Acidobacteriota bacterium]
MTVQSARLGRLGGNVFREEIDAFYVSALSNIRYLTGFTGSAGHLLVEPGRTTLFVDGRYDEQAREQASGVEVRVSPTDPFDVLLNEVRNRRLFRVGVERNRLSLAAYERLRDVRKKIRQLEGAVEGLRAVKSAEEIDRLRKSALLNSEVFESVVGRLRPTWSETRLAGELEFEMRRRGAEGASFPSIVASGTHGARPHAAPRPIKLQRNSLVVVDHGAILDGYASDMTRMISLGRPSSDHLALVDAVREAQQSAIDSVRAGVACSTVDRAARKVLKEKGLDRYFVHSTGHGLGLEIHEAPRIANTVSTRLKAGMVITIEPGVYLEGIGGVRIEDVVVVGTDGCEPLTPTSRELRIL